MRLLWISTAALGTGVSERQENCTRPSIPLPAVLCFTLPCLPCLACRYSIISKRIAAFSHRLSPFYDSRLLYAPSIQLYGITIHLSTSFSCAFHQSSSPRHVTSTWLVFLLELITRVLPHVFLPL
ncbi:hypothetical protein VTL71DRAFT_3307 [Oculimacula yallundae]|uniref:Secreted protein n=1 Tax=Oculimacula yallundae TaxID=86028 RepID=A0ABR4C7K8_9HELO